MYTINQPTISSNNKLTVRLAWDEELLSGWVDGWVHGMDGYLTKLHHIVHVNVRTNQPNWCDYLVPLQVSATLIVVAFIVIAFIVIIIVIVIIAVTCLLFDD